MPFVPVPNTARISVRARLANQDIVNVLWASGPGPISAAGLTVIATLVRNAYRDGVRTLMSNELIYQDVTARAMDTDSGPQVVFPFGIPAVGAAAAQSMPGNVAFVITHRTALIGRSYRGRTYLAGLPETDVGQNTVGAVFAQSCADMFNTLRTSLLASNLTLCVVSLMSGGAPRTTGVATPITLSVARDTRVDTQRRRLD